MVPSVRKHERDLAMTKGYNNRYEFKRTTMRLKINPITTSKSVDSKAYNELEMSSFGNFPERIERKDNCLNLRAEPQMP
jgi:hypothetical protein